MIKVYQTRISNTDGNCAQATIASLLNLKLKDVPDFVRNHHIKPMNPEIIKFLQSKGFNTQYAKPPKKLIRNKGKNGYFYAIVHSQTFNNTQHAVVIDKHLNIIHDPNPNGKCLKLNHNDTKQSLDYSPNNIVKILILR